MTTDEIAKLCEAVGAAGAAGELRSPYDDSLDDADRQLLALLAGGASPTDAAHAAGLSATTCYRRMSRPPFKRALTDARAGLFRPVLSGVAALAPRAVARLGAILADDALPAGVHLKAVAQVFEAFAKLGDVCGSANRVAEFEARLAEAEARLAAADGSPPA